MTLAIHSDNQMFLESPYGGAFYPIAPMPFFSAANVIIDEKINNSAKVSNAIYDCTFIFREDSFDPTTRIRRGRLYQRKTLKCAQPNNISVMSFSELHVPNMSPRSVSAYTFAPYLFDSKAKISIKLGFQSISMWELIDVERISSNEDLITLKSYSSFGLLPTLIISQMPESHQERLKLETNEVAERFYSSAPESIVDLCRKAATTLINCYLCNNISPPPLKEWDLGGAANQLEKFNKTNAKHAKYNLVNLARMIATLHSRGKSNEVANRSLRPVSHKDSELALNSLNCMLCDVGWAKW